MDLMTLFLTIKADTSEAEQSIKKTTGTFKDFVGGFRQGFGEATKHAGVFGDVLKANIASDVIRTGFNSLVNGIKEVSQAIPQAISSTAEYADNIDKMSQKMGMSAEAYQEWSAVLEHSGTSIEALKPSMKTLATQAEKNSDAFQKLGISEKEVASLSQEDLFARTIEGLQQMEEGTERTALTSQLLGRGATELGALLNTSAEDTKKMREEVHKLGGVMSNEAVKAGARYQDSLQDLKTAIGGIKRGLAADFLPGISDVMDGLSKIFSGDAGSGSKMIKDGVQNIAKSLKKSIPTFIQTTKEILKAIAEAIKDNLPIFLEAGKEIFGMIGEGISENIDTVMDILTDVIFALVDGIIQILPNLIDAAIEIFIKIVDGIAENLPKIIPALVEGICKIIKALASHAKEFIEAAAEVIKAIGEGILAGLAELFDQIGLGGLADFFEGLKDMWSGIDADAIARGITGIAIAIGAIKLAQFTADAVRGFKDFCGALRGLSGLDFSKAGELLSGIGDIALPITLAITAVIVGVQIGKKVAKGLINEAFSEAGVDYQVNDDEVDFFVKAGLNMEWKAFQQGGFRGVQLFEVESIKQWVELVKEGDGWLADIARTIEPMVNWWSDALHNQQDFWANIKTSASEAGQNIENAFTSVKDFFSNTFSGIKDSLTTAWENIKSVFEPVGEFFSTIFSTVQESVSTIWNEIGLTISTIWESVQEIFEPVGEWFSEKFEIVKTAVTEAWDGVKEKVSDVWEHIQSIFEPIGEWFREKFETAKQNVIDAFEPVRERLEEVWTNIQTAFENVGTWFQEKFQEAKDNVMNVWNNIKGEFDKVWQNIKSAFDLKDAANWGRDLIQNFTNGISNALGGLRTKIREVANTIKRNIGFSEPEEGPLSDFHTYAPDMMKLFAQGIEQYTPFVRTTLQDAFSFDSIPKEFDFSSKASKNSGSDSILSQIPDAWDRPRDLTVILELDKTQFAKAVYHMNRDEMQRVGVSLAGGV